VDDVNPMKIQNVHDIGIISDTHGLIRPETEKALQGVDLIIHAGDIGGPDILEDLRAIAPVVAVRGNMDRGSWAGDLPEFEILELNGLLVYVVHDIHHLDLDPAAAGFHAVVFGHTHSPYAVKEKGVLFLNPGSAGPKRFRKPVSMARVRLNKAELTSRFIELESFTGDGVS
jgi:putative phosphoesterase